MSSEQQPTEQIDVDQLVSEFTLMCMKKAAEYHIPQERLARCFVVHGAIMTAAIVGAAQCAADLRGLAAQIELGNMPAAGRA